MKEVYGTTSSNKLGFGLNIFYQRMAWATQELIGCSGGDSADENPL